jgi:uncharacterized protein
MLSELAQAWSASVAAEPYWQAARNGKLALPMCLGCGQMCHPSRSICSGCSSHDLQYREVKGNGTVYSYTVVARALIPALRPIVPYLLALIDLTNGPRLVSVLRCPPKDAHIGMPVAVTFEPVSPKLVLPMFVPNKAANLDSADKGIQLE